MNVQIMDTNPPQVCVTYPDGKIEVMYKSEWDQRNN
jgi:hypothetical protein